MQGLCDAAIEAAAAGWRVLPCVPTGPKAKAPLLEHGFHDASRDPDIIRAWWKCWPDALVGAAVPDCLVVIDIDPRNGGSAAALEEAAGSLPETLTVWSGREDGGRHLYFLRPAGGLTGARLPEGIDLKIGGRGYCILPPSPHPATGKAYRWDAHPVAAVPHGLRELLRPADRGQWTSGAGRPGGADLKRGAPLIRLAASLEAGQRNRGLFWCACRAVEAGILDAIAADLVAATVGPGHSERDAWRTIESARRAVRR
jgi:hypothetical protein